MEEGGGSQRLGVVLAIEEQRRGVSFASALRDTQTDLSLRSTDRAGLPEVLQDGGVGVLVLDWRGEDDDAAAVIEAVRRRDPGVPIILVSGPLSVQAAVTVADLGVFAHVVEPLVPQTLSTLVQEALAYRRMLLENVTLRGELRRMQADYDEILTRMPAGVLSVDLETRVTTLNPSAVEICGLPPGDCSLEALARQPGLQAIAELLRVAIEEGRTCEREEVQVSLDEDRQLTLAITTSLRRDKKGGVTGALAIIGDLTQTKSITRHLKRTEKLSTIGTLTSGITHEFSNLLTVVSGFVKLAKRDREIEAVRGRLDIIDETLEKCKSISRNLLGFVRQEDDSLGPVDLRKVVEDCLMLMRKDLEKRQIQVVEDYSDVPPLHANASQLQQVFMNLMLNATQAMPDGGSLTITIQHGGDVVIARVKDTGIGITRRALKSIFQPFYTTKTMGEGGGTGLGLYVSQEIVNAHGGSISVASEEGRGTEFILKFPFTRA